MQNEIPQSIIEKAQKLLNLKEGAEAVGSTAEAEAAAHALNKLLLKHNLDLEMVKEQGVLQRAEMSEVFKDLNPLESKTEAGWVGKLYRVIAEANMCLAIRHLSSSPNDMGDISVIGSKVNVQITHYTVEQLVEKIRIAEKMAFKIHERESMGYGEKRNTFRRGFFIGAVAAISHKLYVEKVKTEDEIIKEKSKESHVSEAEVKKGFELMVVSNKQAIADYVGKTYGALKTSKVRAYTGRSGKIMGYEAGSKMNIQSGISGGGNNKQIK